MADQFVPVPAQAPIAKGLQEFFEKAQWEKLGAPPQKRLANLNLGGQGFSGLSYTSNVTQPANYVSAAQIVGAAGSSSGQS